MVFRRMVVAVEDAHHVVASDRREQALLVVAVGEPVSVRPRPLEREVEVENDGDGGIDVCEITGEEGEPLVVRRLAERNDVEIVPVPRMEPAAVTARDPFETDAARVSSASGVRGRGRAGVRIVEAEALLGFHPLDRRPSDQGYALRVDDDRDAP